METLAEYNKNQAALIVNKYPDLKGLTAELAALNFSYAATHGIKQYDLDNSAKLRQLIELTRDNRRPYVGDVVICKASKRNRNGDYKVYDNGQIDGVSNGVVSICVMPYVPFVHVRGNGIGLSTSGGYWISANAEDCKLVGTREKEFQDWGHCGACGDGAFAFKSTVNVWELTSENIY